MAEVAFVDVEKRYGPVKVISGLNLKIADGEFAVLVGPSGCGKTTSLQMVAGLESVSSGRIFIGGRDVTDLAPKSRDIAWYRVPKPQEGQEGVFLLHRDGLEIGGTPLAILHPTDLLPAEEERVRQISEHVEPRNRR